MTAEDAVLSSFEPSLEDLYENAPVGQVSVDPRDVIVKVNGALLRMLGAAESDLVGTVFRDLLTPGSVLFYDTRFQPVLSLGGVVNEVSLSMRLSGGKTLPVLVNALSVVGEDGAVRVVRMAIFDSTSRQGYERELLLARRAAESSEARVRVLQDASIAFTACSDEEELARSLMESARLAVSASAAAVLLCDDEKKLQPVAGSHPLALTLSRLSQSPVTRSISDLAPVALANAREPGEHGTDTAEALLEARFEAVSVVPLVGDSETVGVLVMFFGRQRTIEPELIGLEEALARQAVQVLTRIRLQAELRRLALHDGLTGLANRVLLVNHLDDVIDHSRRAGTSMAVVFLDLDGFKRVNDELGHPAGDGVLRVVADRLGSAVRESDLVARFGGDEFVVVCSDVDEVSAHDVARGLVAAVAEPMTDLPAAFPITASAGLAIFVPADPVGEQHSGEQASATSILALADAAMYASKEAVRGGITIVRA